MTHNNRILRVIGVLFSFVLLAACSPVVPTGSPTLDPNTIRTEAAATVLAQVTQDLASTPSITPLPSSTATSEPSSTPGPTSSATLNATELLTTGTPGAQTDDKAQWVSQSVADGTSFAPGEAFTVTWRLKNTGTTTWTAGYLFRYFSGETFGAAKEITLGQEVLPGGEVDIIINMKAPVKAGTYRSDWVMSTEFRANFKEPVFLKITVAATATPTPTP